MRDQCCPLCATGGDDQWLLAYDGVAPATEGSREALLALGNGYLATRGAAPEARADGVYHPASYVAGVYNRLISHIDAGDFATLPDAYTLAWKQIWRRLHLSFDNADLADDRRAVNVHLFLTAYGAELLVEIARFWASLATYHPVGGRYHINGVMGPDEFHDGYPDNPGGGLNDNAYVNTLTSWMLARTLDLPALRHTEPSHHGQHHAARTSVSADFHAANQTPLACALNRDDGPFARSQANLTVIINDRLRLLPRCAPLSHNEFTGTGSGY